MDAPAVAFATAPELPHLIDERALTGPLRKTAMPALGVLLLHSA
jgi:hypothetical protein